MYRKKLIQYGALWSATFLATYHRNDIYDYSVGAVRFGRTSVAVMFTFSFLYAYFTLNYFSYY